MTMGKLHSIQSMGLVDGPGVRTVFFLQGCPLRCAYCHNPDTRAFCNGTDIDVDEVLRIASRYKSYYGLNGGITFSGGEPLSQPRFVLEAFKALKERGFNTCLDTSGYGPKKYFDEILKYTDTLLLDIKSFSFDDYKSLTDFGDESVKEFMNSVKKFNINVIIRHVMVPGFTDDKRSMDRFVRYIFPIIDKIDRVEILPFHKMGEDKYEELNIDYKLKEVPEMNKKYAQVFENYVNYRIKKLRQKRADNMRMAIDENQKDKWIEQSYLLKGLTEEERSRVKSGIEFCEMKRGELIFQSLDNADRLYMVCSGKIKIYENTLEGKEQILYIYSEGEFIGGLNVLKETEYLYNGECIEPGVIGIISKDVFDNFLVNNPHVLLRILKMAFERIRLAEDLIKRLTASTTDEKVASLLLKLIPEFGTVKGSKIVLDLSMTREEMGSLVGLTRETLVRKLSEYRNLGIIEASGTKRIVINDIEKLREKAQAFPDDK
ncbi:MAG: pyruvate formate-lyase-activating protein [Tissierellia bacterium]|nr:pyruvate formate-lyase-activating protein [Tissierellia bacterium]